jgi:isopenicillin-N epimerase
MPFDSDRAFPVLTDPFTLDPSWTFLNHGSFGACPRAVQQAQDALRARMERQPVQFLANDYEGLMDAARDALAAFLGADPEGLVFVSNATTGVNAVLQSIDLGPGDDVLVTDHAYNACRNALDRVARKAGARVCVAAVPFPLSDPAAVVQAIGAAVTPRTRIALIDHVTSPTGLVLPIAAIVADLQGRGVDVLVDGAHAPGMVPLDLDRLGAAYYTGNCHKWLCAPKGAAFLWVRGDRREGIRPVVTSHGANSTRTDRSLFRLAFDWTGTADPTPFLSVPAAITFLGGLLPGGWPALMDRNRALALHARDILCQALDVPPPCPDGMIGSLAAVPLPDRAVDFVPRPPLLLDPLQEALQDRARIEVPVMSWPRAPRRLVRVSAAVYNHPGQYRALAGHLRAFLADAGKAPLNGAPPACH